MPPIRQPLTEQETQYLITLYQDGIPVNSLAWLLGRSKEWIRSRITVHIIMRKRGRAKRISAKNLHAVDPSLRLAYTWIAQVAHQVNKIPVAKIARVLHLHVLPLRDALVAAGTPLRHRETRRAEGASQLVNRAVREGRLTRQDCEDCGAAAYTITNGKRRAHTIGHHCDYNKPLEVMWLCPSCHQNWHSRHQAIMKDPVNHDNIDSESSDLT